MSDLNPNAKAFVPSGKLFGPIIASETQLKNIIPGPTIQTKLKVNVKTNKINEIQNDDFTTKLINEKHILITKVNELENIIKIRNNEIQKLILRIRELEKFTYEKEYNIILSQNKKLNDIIAELNLEIKSLTENNKILQAEIDELVIENNELKDVKTNFDKLKKHIGDFIKIKNNRFQNELDEKNAEIEKLKKDLLDVNQFYTFYITKLYQQFANINN